MRTISAFIGLVLLMSAIPSSLAAEDYTLHSFERIPLTDVYYSEGANAGDLNRDGVVDVVHGPFWFEGPDYKTKHEIYPAKPQNTKGYANNFFSWIYDFNGDGWNDVFTVGFPGTPAYVYENPGKDGFGDNWPQHQVFDWVSNESPHFTNIVGDERPELVCTRDGYFGYATIDWDQPFEDWTFHIVSDQTAASRFGHGLGVGDVDRDDRLDIITKDGWYQQPKSLDGDPQWPFHPATFAKAGGAEMYAYDVDGDGDNDVITSLAAHEFGLAWHEQVQQDGKIAFRQHVIMGSRPEDNRYGVLFSELHTVNLADMDGDGLKDIVTGKTYWSHHTKSPMWDAGAVVYWFKLVRNEDGVDWIPYQADGESGVGRQVIVKDVNGDDLPDIVVGGMKGSHVLIHQVEQVDKQRWQESQPKPPVPLAAGLPPEQAAKQMTVPPGFRVRLAAGEPQVHQPIAFTIDHRGRIWLAEAYTYPQRAPEGEGLDKIVILEDTDGDGTLDSRVVFMEGLNLVSGLEVGFGGVWVGAAPYLLFIPDKNGDDIPDSEPQVLLDGFGYQDTHETLNAFIWGPDGWLYGCHGVFTHSNVGKPGDPEEQRVPLNAGVWRYHPTEHQFEVFAWGTSNPWGVDFNDHGQAFLTACVIPHMWHMLQGARYHRQGGRHFNPHVYDDIKTIADHAHYVGNIRDHAWWGKEPQAPADTLAAGGGHAHCGAMIYLGDNWPERYRDSIFFNNIHGNRVNNDVLERQGSGFVGSHGRDLLLANDKWFRGINLKYGPDGSVYLIDWYDPNACHRTNPEIWDRTNGRIYNIAYGDPGQVKVDLSQLSDAELVQLQLHDNDWYVRMSRRLLQQRAAAGDLATADVSEELWDIVRNHPLTPRKLRAIWTLHCIGGLTPDDLLELTQHSDEYVRSWAIQLELQDREASAAFYQRLVEMAGSDPSPVVRLYLSSALGRMPLSERFSLAEALVAHGEDAADHNLPLMYWYGIEPLVPADPSRAMQLAHASQIPLVTQYIIRRAASDNGNLGLVVNSLAEAADPASQLLHLDEMLAAFEGRVEFLIPKNWPQTYAELSLSEDAAIRERADQVGVVLGDPRVYPKFRQILTDDDEKIDRRIRALDILVRGRDQDAVSAFQQVIGEPALRGPAIRALAAYTHADTPQAILSHYDRLGEQKGDAIATLVSRPEYAMALLAAIEEAQVPRTDLHAYHVRQLLRFDNADLKQRIEEVWGEIRETSQDKKKEIAKYKTLLELQGMANANPSNGRRLFSKTCASCHKLFGEGGNVGPDITGSNRANLDYILENVVDPSAVLGKDYRMWLIATESGQVISGLIQKETDSALTVRTINDTVVVPKSEIEELRLSDVSIMPERQLDQLQPEEVRDLVAYLASPTQVTLRGPDAPIDADTKRVPDAIEGEGMKILNKTGGSARSQPMGGFPKDRWSGVDHLWWTGGKPGDKLDLELPVEKAGRYEIELVLTQARDYGVVQLSLDDEKLGEPLDLYNSPDVITTGVLSFDGRELSAGDHKLSVEIIGTNPKAVKAYMFGLDYVRLVER